MRIGLFCAIVMCAATHSFPAAKLGWIEDSKRNRCYGFFQKILKPTWQKSLKKKELAIAAKDGGSLSAQDVCLSGGVQVAYNNTWIQADSASWRRSPEPTIDLKGNVLSEVKGLVAVSDNAQYTPHHDVLSLMDTWYRFTQGPNHKSVWGYARKLLYDTEKDVLHLTDSTASVCAPSNPVWQFHASHLSIDYHTMLAVAQHSWLRLLGVPVLYLPYLQWYIDNQRHTGFLWPQLTYDSVNDLSVHLPYYINIAPEQDLTLSSWFNSNRWHGVSSVYRYLTPWGMVKLMWTQLKDLGQWRSATDVHVSLKDNKWAVLMKGVWVSDAQILQSNPVLFRDYGGLLPQNYSMSYQSNKTKVAVKWQSYQDFRDPNPQGLWGTYEIKPGFELGQYYATKHIDLSYKSSYRDLVPSAAYKHLPAGQEMYIVPSMKSHLMTSAGRFSMALSPVLQRIDSAVSSHEIVPRAKVQWDGVSRGPFQIVLQPSIGYLWAPYTRMSDLPLFDTRARPFELNQLFSFDRYSGYARIGDYDDIDMRIRLMHLDWPVMLTIGQRYAFKHHQQSLSSGYAYVDPLTSSHWSPLLMRVQKPYNNGSIYVNVGLDHGSMKIDHSQVGLTYANGVLDTHLYTASFNKTIDETSQRHPLSIYAIENQWRFDNNWSLKAILFAEKIKDTIVNGQVQLNYEDCCFSAELSAKRQLKRDDVISSGAGLSYNLKISLNGIQ